jgi:SAM-dependent methyltransferase
MRQARNRQAARTPAPSHVYRGPKYRDPQVRTRKAQKVSSIVHRLAAPGSRGFVLDVGCGSGFVAERLSQAGWRTVALDLADNRQTSGFEFLFARAEALPFRDECFSVVASNYVIEHIVDPAAHLSEVRRVLAPGGVIYLAMPNRFAILEAHYRLPFLSWLPRGLADAYVRLLRRAQDYDVFPLTRDHLLREAARVGLECDDITPWMIAETAVVEESRLARLVNALPDRALRWLSYLSPSLVFVMRRDEAEF